MINSFQGKYRFLSNFYPCWIMFDGEMYPSVEHAYQAAKTVDYGARKFFQESIVTAGQAKRKGRKLKIREDWNEVKLNVMSILLRKKFKQLKFRELLLATGDEELVEGNDWSDFFWGICNGKGENHLGRLLMQIREDIYITNKEEDLLNNS